LDSTIIGIKQEILFSRQNDQGRTKASSRRARQHSSKKGKKKDYQVCCKREKLGKGPSRIASRR
jgi:hypothetical protein